MKNKTRILHEWSVFFNLFLGILAIFLGISLILDNNYYGIIGIILGVISLLIYYLSMKKLIEEKSEIEDKKNGI